MPRMRPRSSRRAPALGEADYDHEINIVDQAAEAPGMLAVPSDPSLGRASTESRPGPGPGPGPGPSTAQRRPPPSPQGSTSPESSDEEQPPDKGLPTVEVEEATPAAGPHAGGGQPQPPTSPESAIDILYENERGAIVCGVALFSSAALGNLDPPPWTNSAHRPSPTDILTAQVPDPSWEWAWPEWHINHDEETDEGGWEYSFAFAKKFSWHRPKWWNSFVRRRAWIRRRVKKGAEYLDDPHLLNGEYFTVRPASRLSQTTSRLSRVSSRASRGSRASRVTSKASVSQLSRAEGVSTEPDALEAIDIEDVETLMDVLRCARIDREKIEAVENFLANGEDELARLQEEIHEIMALFVFQASRQLLLARLTDEYGEAQEKLEREDSRAGRRRVENLEAAVRHADEEVRRLEYWSDIKSTILEGRSGTGVAEGEGWGSGWQDQGLGNSGPAHPSD